MDFFGFPVELNEKHLWPLLDWNDLLRMRRVCKTAKLAMKNYMSSSNFVQSVPEIEIDEDDKSIDKLVTIGLPVTKIYINNQETGLVFYDLWSRHLNNFLHIYKDKITHLRVNILCRIPARSELAVLESLSNLKSLTAMNMEAVPPSYFEHLKRFKRACRRTLPPDEAFSLKDNRPKIYEKLQEVDIAMETNFDRLEDSRNIIFTSLIFTDGVFPMLESVKVPFVYRWQDAHEIWDVPQSFFSDAHSLCVYFKHLRDQLLESYADGDKTFKKLGKLKRMSFEHFYYPDEDLEMKRHVDQFGSPEFLPFLETVTGIGGIQLEFVNAVWFMMASQMQSGSCIVSMVNIHPAAIDYMQSENLEKVVINSASSCVLTSASGYLYRKEAQAKNEVAKRPAWPKLKTLIVNVNGDYLSKAHGRRRRPNGGIDIISFSPRPVSDLFTFLFKQVTTFNLTQLSLSFQHLRDWVPSQETVKEIVKSCPNVKYFSLAYWNGTNKSLTMFWDGMPGLEAVGLHRCEGLGNVAFVGKDIENPIFLKLKKLKSLTFMELERMPKITDTLFRLVISRIRLQSLILHSFAPVKSVTVDGIRSLLNGPFAETIESFPFDDWSLYNCPEKKFLKLSKEFRSYDMV